MVGLRRAKTLVFVVLVVMATTIANGAKMLQENDKDEPSKGSVQTRIDVKALGAKADGKTDDSKVRSISYSYTSSLSCYMVLSKNMVWNGCYIYRHLRMHGKKHVN